MGLWRIYPFSLIEKFGMYYLQALRHAHDLLFTRGWLVRDQFASRCPVLEMRWGKKKSLCRNIISLSMKYLNLELFYFC